MHQAGDQTKIVYYDARSTNHQDSFIDTNLIHNFLYKLHKIKFLYMFRASTAHFQEAHDINCTYMQPLVFSFSKGESLLYCTWNLLSFC